MDKVRRILVYVCREGAAPQRAPFVQVSSGRNRMLDCSCKGGSDQVGLPGVTSCVVRV